MIGSRIQLSLTLCDGTRLSMTEQRFCGFALRRAALLLPLFLAGCAGEAAKPSQGAAYTPAPASSFTVTLRPGDSLSEVAKRYDVKKDDLLAPNEIPNQDRSNISHDLPVPAYA